MSLCFTPATRRAGITLLLASAVACSRDVGPESPPPSEVRSVGQVEVLPMCDEGFCTDDDPSPTSPGYYVSYTVTAETCFGGVHTDVDQDGLSDQCEHNLAYLFSPELIYSSTDFIGGEVRWAARPLFDGIQLVRVLILPSYYVDRGSTHPLCNNSIGDGPCSGHFGDSEAIALDIYFDPATQHWVLHRAFYSAHDHYNAYGRGSSAYPPQLT